MLIFMVLKNKDQKNIFACMYEILVPLPSVVYYKVELQFYRYN